MLPSDNIAHTSSSLSAVLHLQFRPTLKALNSAGVSVLPKSRKARALLALVGLSDGCTISRAHAAAMLWSHLARAESFARLRHTLHHLQQGFITAGVAPLVVADNVIALCPEMVRIDISSSTLGVAAEAFGYSEFLNDLDGLDASFDRWLISARQKIRRRLTTEVVAETTHGQVLQKRSSSGPSLIVTVFDSVDPNIESYVARTLSEEVGSALTMLRWVKIITRSAKGHAFTFSDTEFPEQADYLLVGDLRRDKNSYLLALKLLDLKSSGRILWAENIRDTSDDLLTMQRGIAYKITAMLDTELLFMEAERHRTRNASLNNDSYDLVLRAIPDVYRLDRDTFLRAGRTLAEAVDLDPESAFAHTWLAYWNMFLIGQGWAASSAQAVTEARHSASRAIVLDPKDARAATIAGHVKAFLNYQLEEAATLHELALQLNPALSLAWHLYGVVHAYAGRLDEAQACLSRCRELAPNNPHGFYAEGAFGIVHLLQGNYEMAVAVGRRVTERHPQFTSAYKSYLAALGHLGRKMEAASVLQRLAGLEPQFNIQHFRSSARYQRPQDMDCFLTGLRLAGVT